MYPTASWDELEMVFNIQKSALLHKASDLGIKRNNVNFAKYSTEDIQYIKENYMHVPLKEMCEHLNRSESAIYTKIRNLKLDRVKLSYTKQDIQLLKKVYSDYSNQELSEIFFPNRTPNALRTMGKKLHLQKKHNSSQEKKYDKNIMLQQFKDLAKQLGRTPLATELQNYGLPSESTYCRYFLGHKGYREFCQFLGLPINKSLFSNKDCVFTSKKGDICFSKSELMICDYLFHKGIPYRKEELLYKDIFGIEEFGQKRIDWLLEDNTAVEYFGMMDLTDYQKKAQDKINLCKKYNINLIEIYPKDMMSLDKIFSKYIK